MSATRALAVSREHQDETRPLLRKTTPLPKLQLAVLCFVRLAEPIAFTQIFPFVNKMMEHLHVTDNPAKIGFYSGLVESCFAFAQLLLIFRWARLSDRLGRKPVILCGLCGSVVTICLFGLSKSLWWAVAVRILGGASSGNAAVIQSVVGELTDETNQAMAFPLLSLCWNIGCIVGPLIGGTLSEPARRYPHLFGQSKFLKEYPFFLPCAASATLTLSSILLGAVFLKETLPSKAIVGEPGTSQADRTEYGTIGARIESPPVAVFKGPSIKSLLGDSVTRSVLRPYFLLSVEGTGFDALFVLTAYTPIRLGGLSRKPAEIGLALAFGGLVAAVIQPFIFAALARRFRIVKIYPCLMAIFPAVYFVLPFLNVVTRKGLRQGSDVALTPHATWILWLMIGIILITEKLATMSFAANMILLRHAAATPAALGGTFGVGQTVASIGRGIAPALASSIYALSLQRNLLGGTFVWLVMAVISLLGVASAFRAQDGVEERARAESRLTNT